MHRSCRLMLVLFILGLGGCSNLMNFVGASEGFGVADLKMDESTPAQRLRTQIEIPNGEKQGASKGIVAAKCFSVPLANSSDGADCQSQRNAAVYLLMTASDDLCQKHLKEIFGNDAAFNITTGTVAVASSGAASVAGTSAAKSALAAISTFANAERSLVNETVYRNMIVTSVTKKIREARTAKASAILPNAQKSMNDYPMTAALHDIMDYHYSCSFMYGLEKALDEGVQSGTDLQRARLEKEKRDLELYVDNRRMLLSHEKSVLGDPKDDIGVKGALARIAEIDVKLKSFVSGPTALAGAEGTRDAEASTGGDFYARYGAALTKTTIVETSLAKELADLSAGIQKEKLDPRKYGLKSSLDTSAWITTTSRDNCSKKMRSYFVDERNESAKAAAETDSKAKSDALAKAAEARARGEVLAAFLLKLADEYARKVGELIARLSKLADEATSSDTQGMTAFKNALASMPRVADAQQEAELAKLCN